MVSRRLLILISMKRHSRVKIVKLFGSNFLLQQFNCKSKSKFWLSVKFTSKSYISTRDWHQNGRLATFSVNSKLPYHLARTAFSSKKHNFDHLVGETRWNLSLIKLKTLPPLLPNFFWASEIVTSAQMSRQTSNFISLRYFFPQWTRETTRNGFDQSSNGLSLKLLFYVAAIIG